MRDFYFSLCVIVHSKTIFGTASFQGFFCISRFTNILQNKNIKRIPHEKRLSAQKRKRAKGEKARPELVPGILGRNIRNRQSMIEPNLPIPAKTRIF
jgi:hypothetical protein